MREINRYITGVCTWWIHRRSQTEPELCSRLQVQCRSEKNKKKVFLPVCLGIVAQQAALGVLVWKHLRNTREQESLRWNHLLGFSFNTTTICVFNRQQKVVLCFGNRVSTDVKWLKHSRENNALIFVVFWFRWTHKPNHSLEMHGSNFMSSWCEYFDRFMFKHDSCIQYTHPFSKPSVWKPNQTDRDFD